VAGNKRLPPDVTTHTSGGRGRNDMETNWITAVCLGGWLIGAGLITWAALVCW
jgi:hypothetical protein